MLELWRLKCPIMLPVHLLVQENVEHQTQLGAIHKWRRSIEQPTVTEKTDKSWQGKDDGWWKIQWFMGIHPKKA